MLYMYLSSRKYTCMEVYTHHYLGAILTMYEDRDEDEQKLRGLDFQQAALKSSGGRSIQILHLSKCISTTL